MKKKQLHQIKTKWYYIFWGICTVSVVFGQLYVGSGYRMMAESNYNFIEFLKGELEQTFDGELY